MSKRHSEAIVRRAEKGLKKTENETITTLPTQVQNCGGSFTGAVKSAHVLQGHSLDARAATALPRPSLDRSPISSAETNPPGGLERWIDEKVV